MTLKTIHLFTFCSVLLGFASPNGLHSATPKNVPIYPRSLVGKPCGWAFVEAGTFEKVGSDFFWTLKTTDGLRTFAVANTAQGPKPRMMISVPLHVSFTALVLDGIRFRGLDGSEYTFFINRLFLHKIPLTLPPSVALRPTKDVGKLVIVNAASGDRMEIKAGVLFGLSANPSGRVEFIEFTIPILGSLELLNTGPHPLEAEYRYYSDLAKQNPIRIRARVAPTDSPRPILNPARPVIYERIAD